MTSTIRAKVISSKLFIMPSMSLPSENSTAVVTAGAHSETSSARRAISWKTGWRSGVPSAPMHFRRSPAASRALAMIGPLPPSLSKRG